MKTKLFANGRILALAGLILSTAIFGIILLDSFGANAQGNWTQKANFGGTTRYGAVGFSIGSKGYIGTGYDGSNRQDFWEWDQATDTWTQKANFQGAARNEAVGFSIGTKGYIGTGWDVGTRYKDFWEWNQATNIWIRKADFGGTERMAAVGFSIGAKGYIGTGDDGTGSYQKDFWEWDQATDTWTKKTNFVGTARYSAVGFSIGSKGYVGTGREQGGTLHTQDFWEWDQATDTWTQKANFAGTAREQATGFSIGNKGYIGAGTNGTNMQDFWEWDQATDTWTQKASFLGTARFFAVGFSINAKGYIGTGYDAATWTKDFYEFNPITAPSICLVTVDSLSQHNVIVWDKTQYSHVDSFIVYREYTTNNYVQIGAVPYDSLSQFIDTVRVKYFPITGDPNTTSYRYKLQIRDSSGNYSELGLYHNTVHMLNTGGNFSWNFYDIENNPNPVTFYILKRDNLSNGNWITVAGVSGTQNSITDTQYATYQNTGAWRVETQWSISCTPTRVDQNVMTTISTSRSNLLTTNVTGINEAAVNNGTTIFPNPFSSSTTLQTNQVLANATLAVYNSYGQEVKQLRNISGHEINIERGELPGGLYFIRLMQDNKIIASEKLVITNNQ